MIVLLINSNMETTTDQHYVLAFDIGGTNSRYRVVKRSTSDESFREVVHKGYFKNLDHPSIESVLEATFKVITVEVKVCALAIAGANLDRKVKVTNIAHWPVVDAEDLKKKFNLDKLYLLNDFEANGYGAATMDVHNKDRCVVINEGTVHDNGTNIIVGPGTGLGCAIMTYNDTEGDYNVHPGEGGHVEWVVTNEEELKLRNFTIEWFKEKEGIELQRISTERLCCGPALPLLYAFFRREYPDANTAFGDLSDTGDLTPEQVLIGALQDKDEICVKVIKQFIKTLATFIGDITIVTLCTKIYICGGVAVALKDHLLNEEESNFLKILSNKGRMSNRISHLPVYLIIDEVGLDGAEAYAIQAIHHNYREK